MTGTINTATISIANDDCDENPYTFDVIGQSQEALSIADQDLLELIRIVPNPARDSFKLDLPDQLSINRLEVYSLEGKRVLNKTKDEGIDIIISVKNLSGLYFLKIHAKNRVLTKKLVVY